MKYALGNILNGAGGLNADQLALDLQFAADKTLTARKGPTPVFTRASSGTFVGSNGLIQSAGNNVARFDHDPVTLASRGLLIEESRTNELTRSNEFTDASWIKTTISTGSTTNLSPDGNNNATLLIAGSGSVSWIYKSAASPSGKILTFFAKSSGKRWAVVDASSGAGTAGVWFDLQNGVTGTVQTGYTASIDQFQNGFYRCRVTYPSSGAGGFVVIGVSDSNSSFVSTASGSNGIIVYGAQLEAGSFPTSYIPTTTASVVRSADVCSISGANFTNLWNGVDATILFIGSRNATQVGQINWGVSSGTFGTNIQSDRTATAERISAAGTGILNASGVSPLTTYKIATALKTGDYALSLNGGSAVTSSNSFALSLSRMDIGCSYASSFQLNGCISNLRLFKKRLANAKLQAITV